MDPVPLSEPADVGVASQRRRALAWAHAGSWHRALPDGRAEVDLAWCLSLELDPCAGPDHLERWARRIHPDDADRFLRAHADLVAVGGRGEFEVEYRVLTRDSRWLWLLQRGGVSRRALDGAPLEAGGICIDIDARKRAEVETRQNDARLETAIWGAGVGLYEFDCRGDRTHWFDDWCARFDIDPCAGEGHVDRWDGNIHPMDLPAARARFSAHLEGREEDYDAEYRIRTRSGAWRWIFDRGRVVERDAQGRALRLVGTCMDVDERRRAKIAIEQSQQRLKLALHAARGCLWEWDVEREVFNDEYYQLCGVDPREGRKDREFWANHAHPEDLRRNSDASECVISGRQDAYDAQYRILHADGRWRWIVDRFRGEDRDEHGRARRLVGFAVDITAEVAAREARLESERTLAAVTAHAPALLMLLDTDGIVRFINRPFPNRSIESLLGRRVDELVEPELAAVVQPVYAAVLGDGQPRSVQLERRHDDGSTRFYDHRVAPVLSDGRVAGLSVFGVDITEQVAQRQQVATQAALLSMMREAVVLVDVNRRVRLSNPAFDAMVGAPIGSLQGASIAAVLATATGDVAPFEAGMGAELQRASSQGQVKREFEWRRPDGRVLHLIGTFTLLQIDAEAATLAVYLDVTQQRLLERRLLAGAAVEQRRLGAALHDGLGQELTGIALLLRSLAATLDADAASSRDRLDEIIMLVNGAIDSTRRLARGFAPVSSEQGGLRGALRTLADAARTDTLRVTFVDELAADPPLSDVAATHLLRIAQEAIANAKKHANATHLLVALARSDGELQLTISDDGQGFPDSARIVTGGGIEMMRYRAEALHGQLQIIDDSGVTIRCRVPVH
jgi:PAS domain S-box-containing protein